MSDHLQQMLDQAIANLPPHILQAAAVLQRLAGKTKDGKWVLSSEAALNAAIWQMATGAILGVDFYITPNGQVVRSYTGDLHTAAREGVGPIHYQFRAPTEEERREHGIQPNDVAAVCEITQLDLTQLPGYTPMKTVGVVTEAEMYHTEQWDEQARRFVPVPREKWRPKAPPTGRTWRWVAEKRALKAGLRMLPSLRVPESMPQAIERHNVLVDEQRALLAAQATDAMFSAMTDEELDEYLASNPLRGGKKAATGYPDLKPPPALPQATTTSAPEIPPQPTYGGQQPLFDDVQPPRPLQDIVAYIGDRIGQAKIPVNLDGWKKAAWSHCRRNGIDLVRFMRHLGYHEPDKAPPEVWAAVLEYLAFYKDEHGIWHMGARARSELNHYFPATVEEDQ